MDFAYTPEQESVRASVRELAERALRPRARAFEEAGGIAPDVLQTIAAMGLFGILVPEEYGGADLDPVTYCIVIEELARGCASTAITISVSNSVVAAPIAAHGTAEQKQWTLPRLARGEWLGAFCLTEPQAGSDVAAIRTLATRTPTGYRLQGAKAWVTNAGWAHLFIVFALTEPTAGGHGMTAFLVESDAPGVRVGAPERKMGLRASSTAPVYLDGCEVPAAARLGEEGGGMALALETLDAARIGVAAQSVGIAQAGLEEAVNYARARHAFGQPIADFGAVRAMLADMAAEVEAARLLTLRAAGLKARGAAFGRAASMAKLYASEAANRVVARSVQIHGAAGFSAESRVERLYRDARVTTIYEGTSEIQRLVIARHLLGRAARTAAPSGRAIA